MLCMVMPFCAVIRDFPTLVILRLHLPVNDLRVFKLCNK